MCEVTIILSEREDTEKLGYALAEAAEPGDFYALQGEMGVGKTTLACAMAEALGVEDASSPTYALVHEYAGRVLMFHLDAWRLTGPEELEELDFAALLHRNGVVVLEWPEYVEAALPADRLSIEFSLDVERGLRTATLKAAGERYVQRLSKIQEVYTG